MIINKLILVVIALGITSLECLRYKKAQKKSENTFSEEANNFLLQKVYILQKLLIYISLKLQEF